LLVAHETIDAELRKWAEGVERGFAERGIAETNDCNRVERDIKTMRQELKVVEKKLGKRKSDYERINQELVDEQALRSKNKTDYKELLQDLKKDKRRPIMAEETAEIESKIEKIKKAKVDFHLQNDELERTNQVLRASLAVFTERRFHCRVDDQPDAELKPETKKMIGEMLRLGVPKEGVNAVANRILGLSEYRLESQPTQEEINRIAEKEEEKEDEDEEDEEEEAEEEEMEDFTNGDETT